HEVYMRLLQDAHLSWQNRAHFFGIAVRSMRQILIERSRARQAAKRGGERVRVTLDPGLNATSSPFPFRALSRDSARSGRGLTSGGGAERVQSGHRAFRRQRNL